MYGYELPITDASKPNKQIYQNVRLQYWYQLSCPEQPLLEVIQIRSSIYGATAPSGPSPPLEDASIHPYFLLFSSIL